MTRSNNESSQGFQGLKELQGNFPTKSNSTPSKQHKKSANKKADNENTKHQSFSVRLTRRITVKRYPIIATVCLLEERTDIVNLLKQAKLNGSALPERLTEYLKKERLLDAQLQLTDKAEQVLLTGKMPIFERGLYHVWYSEGDLLLGTRALVIQRDEAFKEPKYEVFRKGPSAEHSPFSFKISEKIKSPLTVKVAASKASNNLQLTSRDIISIKPEVICKATDSKKITLTWDISFTSSTFMLDGDLNILSGRNQDQIAPVKYNLKSNDFAQHNSALFQILANELNGNWQEQSKRAQLPFELTKKYPNIVNKFQLAQHTIQNLQTELGHFENVVIKNLPAEPLNEEQSLWHQLWLEQYYRNDYIDTNIAQNAQLNWLDLPALTKYDLQPLLGNVLINSFSKEKDTQAFWQCAAMHDLTPNSLNETQTSFTLASGDEISLKQLLQKLTFNKPVTHFLFSDRFIINNRQQSLLTALCQSLDPHDVTILTLEESKKNLSSDWNIELFKKQRQNHDRYWIFQSGDSVMAWKCTTSLDFLKPSTDDYIVEGHPTFIPVKENELPSYLLDKLAEICVTESA